MFKLYRTAALIAAAVIFCGGCSNAIPDTSDTVSDTSSESTSAYETVGGIELEAAPEGYPVIVNDTEIQRSPERVICLSGGLIKMIYELGYGSRLIGRGSYCTEPSDAASLTDFGRPASPDLEAIKSASPDLLITGTSIPGKDTAMLAEYGINVLLIPSPRSFEEFGRMYSALGMVFEGMFDGDNTGTGSFAEIKNKFTNSNIDLGTFVYITEGLTAAGGDTFESSVLSMFGTNTAAYASGYSYDKTLLAAEQPDTIVLNSEISLDELKSDSILGSLDAVTSGNIITVSNSYFESPSADIAGLIDELSAAGE